MVLAGKPLSASERTSAQSCLPPGSFLELNKPPGPDLEWLYGNAWALLVTSFDEGFGLPIIEGQACGCPVFVPDKEPMTEIGGDGVVRIDPSSPTSAAKVMMDVMQDISALQARGYENVGKFSGEAMITAYADLYKSLAAGGAA